MFEAALTAISPGQSKDWHRRKRAKDLIRSAERFSLAETLHTQALTAYGRHVWNLEDEDLHKLEVRFYAMMSLLDDQRSERSVN